MSLLTGFFSNFPALIPLTDGILFYLTYGKTQNYGGIVC